MGSRAKLLYNMMRGVVFVCDIPVCVCSTLCAGYVLLQFRCAVSMCLCIVVFRWQPDAASTITRTLILLESHRESLHYLPLFQESSTNIYIWSGDIFLVHSNVHVV